jgi:GTP cyclohydrolase I
MTDKVYLTHEEVYVLAIRAAKRMNFSFGKRRPRVYAIPRGGIPAAYAMGTERHFDMVNDPKNADYIVDDLIDSGETMERVIRDATNRNTDPTKAPPTPIVLIDKLDPGCDPRFKDAWIVFPWEVSEVGSIEDNVKRLLQFIGENPDRGGLLETPARVAKAWQFWASGYGLGPADVLKSFEDGAEGCDEMVVVKDFPFYSHCEHHLAPFFGTATIAYIPDGKVVGLSKLGRLLNIYARRLQVQERLTVQVADALMQHLQPKGVGVLLKARHLCMESRGVSQQGHHTRTSALRGVFKQDPAVRAEFLSLDK